MAELEDSKFKELLEIKGKKYTLDKYFKERDSQGNPLDEDDEGNIYVFEGETLVKLSKETVKLNPWKGTFDTGDEDDDDGNDEPEIKHFDKEKVDDEWKLLLKMYQDIIDKSIELQIQFGSEKYDTSDSIQVYENNIFHKDVNPNIYEKGLVGLNIRATFYNRDKHVELMNYIINYTRGGGGDGEETEDFIPRNLESDTIVAKDYDVKPPVAYLKESSEYKVEPLLIIPNVASRLNSTNFEDPNNKRKIIPLTKQYNLTDVYTTLLFIKTIELFDQSTIFILPAISSHTAGKSDLEEYFVREGTFTQHQFDSIYEEYQEKTSKTSLIAELVNRLRPYILPNMAFEKIARLFNEDDVEVLALDETKTAFLGYQGLVDALKRYPLVYMNGILSKNIKRYFPSGIFTTIQDETFQYSNFGRIEKDVGIETLPTLESGAVQFLRKLNRRIIVKPTGVISSINVEIDESEGRVYHTMENDGFLDVEEGQRVRNLSIPTTNWDDAVAISKEMNQKYTTLVFKNIGGEIYGKISTGFFQKLLTSSINFSYNYEGNSERGGITFTTVLREDDI